MSCSAASHRVYGHDIADRTITAHRVSFAEIIDLRSLYRYLIFGDTSAEKYLLDLIKSVYRYYSSAVPEKVR